MKDSPVAPGILSAGLCGFLSIDVREKEPLFVNLKAGGQYKFLKALYIILGVYTIYPESNFTLRCR